MKKILISSMLLMSGFAAIAANSGTGVMTATYEYGMYTKEDKTFEVKGSYQDGVVSVTGFGGYNGTIRFNIDLMNGEVDSDSNQGASAFSDTRTCDFKLHGDIYNTPDGGSEMILGEWGKYTSGIIGYNFYDGTYVNTKIVFDFPIEDLAEPEHSGILGDWDFELEYYPYNHTNIYHQTYKASLKNGYVIFTPFGQVNTNYNLPLIAGFNVDTNNGFVGSGLVEDGYMGSYDVYFRGVRFINWNEFEFEGGSFMFTFDEENRCIEFSDEAAFQWVLYLNGKYHMETVPYMLMYAEQLIDGKKRSVDIADVSESKGVFTVHVDEFGMPDPSKIELYYRLSSEGDFIKAEKTDDLTYTFNLNGLGLVDGMTYNVYLYAASGRTSSEITEYAYTVGVGVDNSGVESVVATKEGAKYFNLLGEEIKNPAPGTICIKVEGNKVTKILVK